MDMNIKGNYILGLANGVLNSGVVLISGGLNSGILLYNILDYL